MKHLSKYSMCETLFSKLIIQQRFIEPIIHLQYVGYKLVKVYEQGQKRLIPFQNDQI